MNKISNIREPRYKIIVLAAPIIPLSRGPIVYSFMFKFVQTIISEALCCIFGNTSKFKRTPNTEQDLS